MLSIPTRLISSAKKVKIINSNRCGNCKLNRRTNLSQVLTPGDELDANIWKSKDIFGLSVNIDLCNIEELPIDSFKDDVNIIPIEKDIDSDFTSDSQLSAYDFENIQIEKLDTLIIYMITKELLGIEGTYPFKGGTPEEKIYNFKIELHYKPMVLNAFHFQVEILSNENGNWEKINRENNKKYIRSLASKIRNKILEERKIYSIINPLPDNISNTEDT